MHRLHMVADALRRDPGEDALAAVVRYFQTEAASDGDVAFLAECLAGRDSKSHPAKQSSELTDVASTGGPSSLSTLLCPLYLRLLGKTVLKVGVPGRPAGGIDVLAQIPGYRVNLDLREASRCLEACGYAHCLPNSEFAKLDGILFNYRQRTATVDIPELVIASLLSKKLAAGLTEVGLDIRIGPHGNFGHNWDEARLNAQRFARVASLLGIRATVFLTDGSTPYQRYIGRGEALLAIADILSDRSSEDLRRHADLCFLMARDSSGDITARRPETEAVKRVFFSNLVAQGASPEAFRIKVASIREGRYVPVASPGEGFLCVELGDLRSILSGIQNRHPTEDPFPDPCGIILERTTGDYVFTGQTVAMVRIDGDIGGDIIRLLSRVFRNVPHPPAPTCGVEVINV